MMELFRDSSFHPNLDWPEDEDWWG